MSDIATPSPVSAPAPESSEVIQESNEVIADPANLTVAEKKMLKQLDIKYNGKSEKFDLPFEIPEEHADWMRKQAQLAKMSQSKAQETANLERDVTAFLHELQTNPRKALSDPRYGVDLKKVAAEILQEEFERSQKSPEELAHEEYEAERKAFLDEKKKFEDDQKTSKQQAEIEKAALQYDTAMSSALDNYSIPKTAMAMHKMASYMALEIQRGYEPDMDIIASKVEEDLATDYRDLLKAMPHEKRLKLLGEEIFEEDRKARVARMKKAPSTAKNIAQDIAKVAPKKDETKAKQTFKQRFGI